MEKSVEQQEWLNKTLKAPIHTKIGYFKGSGNLEIFFNLCNNMDKKTIKQSFIDVFDYMKPEKINHFFSKFCELTLEEYYNLTTEDKLVIVNKKLKELVCTTYQNHLEDFIYFHMEKGDPMLAYDITIAYLKKVKENRREELLTEKKRMQAIRTDLEQWNHSGKSSFQKKKI